MAHGMVYGWLKLDELKQLIAIERLHHLENNKTRCAESLGISRPTLNEILDAFEKRTAEDKQRITDNNERMKVILNQESKSWGHDVNTGMSVPLPPAPLPKIEMFKPKPVSDDPLSQAAEKINNQPRIENTFNPTPKPSPIIAPANPLLDEAAKEKARFEKLDKTPYSVVHKTAAREELEKAELNKPKVLKPKAKKEKAGRKVS